MDAFSHAIEIKRLKSGDGALARALFAVMATVFEERPAKLALAYVEQLLERDDLWFIAGLAGAQPIAGLTAFVLPLTRSQKSELLIYDVVVHEAYQRRGIGRRLMQEAIGLASQQGIQTTWVPAANEDEHAIDFYRAIGGAPTAVTIFTFEAGD